MAIRLLAIWGVLWLIGGDPGMRPCRSALLAAEDLVDLTGRVVDAEGKPVAGAQVRSYLLSYPPPAGRLEAEATTGEDGSFALKGLPPTEGNSFRTILVQAEGYGLGGALQPKPGLILRLGPAGSIVGRITGPGGKAIAGVSVRVAGIWLPEEGLAEPRFLQFWGDAAVLEARSDAAGTFTLNGLPAGGRASLLVQSPDYGRCERNNVAVGSEEVSLTLEPPGRIEGRVLAGKEEAPVAGATVYGWWLQSGMTWASARTDEEGRYVLTGLGPGLHRLAVKPTGAYEGWFLSEPERNVGVKAGETTADVVLRLTPGETVRGRVVDAETGKPLAGVSVEESSSFQSVKTKEDGTFELRAAPGEIWISIQEVPPGYARDRMMTSRRLTVQAGAGAADIEFKLQRGVSVKGQVVDPAGRPVPGAVVRYVRDWAMSEETADDEGRFTLEGLLPGKSLVLWTSVPEKGWAGQLSLPMEKATLEPVTLKLGRAAAVRLTVTDPQKQPIEGIEIEVFKRCETGEGVSYDGTAARSKRSGKATYDIQGLVPGQEYYLQVTAEGYGHLVSGQFKLEAGETRELLPMVLRVADAVVEGRVIDPAGRPIAGAQVEVHSGRFAQATTDAHGRFRLEKQPHESLFLRVTHPDYEENYQAGFNPDEGSVEFILLPRFRLVQALARPGEPAPELDCAYWLNSDRLTWPKLRGKVVLLVFSSAWNGPCEQLLPTLKDLQARYAARGFTVLQVQDCTATLAELRAWVKARGIPYPVAMVRSGMDDGWLGETFRRYGVQAVPALFLVDREGRLQPVQSMAGLSEQIERLL
jgi:protocatechuate 3,4-dioxygenase beta subunit/thiol-disulfide isomerase/thioredoxin